jgi:hypothetical protein
VGEGQGGIKHRDPRDDRIGGLADNPNEFPANILDAQLDAKHRPAVPHQPR